jgi:hypothetical protein
VFIAVLYSAVHPLRILLSVQCYVQPPAQLQAVHTTQLAKLKQSKCVDTVRTANRGAVSIQSSFYVKFYHVAVARHGSWYANKVAQHTRWPGGC